jgi:hypothetical protein
MNGMSGPFSRRSPAACDRCQCEREATWPWAGWGTLRKFWLVLIFCLVFSSPLYLADMHGLLPAAMIMVVAIGPLNALARIRPTCLTCGAVVEPQPRAVAKLAKGSLKTATELRRSTRP